MKISENLIVRVTVIFEKVPEGYIGSVREIPGANSQGKTLKETRQRLKEAVELLWLK